MQSQSYGDINFLHSQNFYCANFGVAAAVSMANTKVNEQNQTH